MTRSIQQMAAQINMSHDEFIGEMRKRGCSVPTAEKIWEGKFQEFDDFKDDDIYLSNLRKAGVVLKVTTGELLPQ